MVKVAQLVRALDCGSRGRGFKSRLSPFSEELPDAGFYVWECAYFNNFSDMGLFT